MGDNEIDQTTVDVIKTILESKNGKKWFTEYLMDNLKLELSPGYHTTTIHLSFNGMIVSTMNMSFSTTVN